MACRQEVATNTTQSCREKDVTYIFLNDGNELRTPGMSVISSFLESTLEQNTDIDKAIYS